MYLHGEVPAASTIAGTFEIPTSCSISGGSLPTEQVKTWGDLTRNFEVHVGFLPFPSGQITRFMLRKRAYSASSESNIKIRATEVRPVKERTMSNPIIDKSRSVLELQVESFLTNGGEIQQIPTGTTGVKPKEPWKKSAAKSQPQSSLPGAATSEAGE
jgi:hypothetical protein